jgi:hypothetical protein
MASVQEPYMPRFFPSSLFEYGSKTAVEEGITWLPSFLQNTKRNTTASQPERLKRNYTLSILAKIIRDPQLAPNKMEKYINDPKGLMTAHGPDIWHYAEQWTVDLSHAGEVECKMEECIWTNTILYAIGGWNKEEGFCADFIL